MEAGDRHTRAGVGEWAINTLETLRMIRVLGRTALRVMRRSDWTPFLCP